MEAFNRRQLQDGKALLDTLAASGLTTIAEALAALDSAIGPLHQSVAFAAPPAAKALRACPTINPDGSLCPGHLAPVRNAEGLAIVGCHVCRYSRIEEAR